MLHGPNYCVCFAPRHRSSPPTGDVSLCLPRGGLRLFFVERLENLLSVPFRLDLGPATSDSAIRIDQECGALDAHERLAVVHLLNPRAVALRDGVILIGE